MSALSPADHAFLAHLVQERSAILLPPSKAYLLQARLAPLATEDGHGSIADLVAHLRRRRDPGTEARVVEAMTTNETLWFRDGRPFAALREHVVPDVLARNAASRTLRVWSAACSTGQELYSVAMLLDSAFPELATWSVDLVGTDLSPAVVARARRGSYSAVEVGRGLPAAMMRRYTERDGDGHRVVEALRRRTRFTEENLIGRWGCRPPQDVVLLRNVLIYFDVAVKREVLAKVRSALRPGGYLLLGTGETTLGVDAGFRAVPVAGPAVVDQRD